MATPKCPKRDCDMEEAWGCLLDCPKCDREHQESIGCKCGGTMICPECLAVGATDENGRKPKCEPDCSTLCPVCVPDD